MRWLQSVLVILALAGAYLGLAHLSGGAFPTLGLQLGGEEGDLRRIVTSFWEDIQFKDFDKAASYHAPDTQAGVDIPYLLERLFALKPELLDVLSAEIVLVDVDSSGLRSRVKTRLRVNNLAEAKLYEKEVMLYFKRADPASPWLMDLQTSLRELDVDKDKKH
jgi:hypothetical protein